MFRKGDFKYMILDMLKDKPGHGYEIIRDLEERSSGFYVPSAGMVYPTLQLLEDLGYVTSAQRDGKKVYSITEDGKKFLKEQETTVNEIKDNVKDWCGCGFTGEFPGIMRDIGKMAQMCGRGATKVDKEKLQKIHDIIHKATGEIETVLGQ